jgi:hypothetical protein
MKSKTRPIEEKINECLVIPYIQYGNKIIRLTKIR